MLMTARFRLLRTVEPLDHLQLHVVALLERRVALTLLQSADSEQS